MSDIAMGAALLQIIQEAFGLGDRKIRHAVLDIQADGAVKLYCEEFVPEDNLNKLATLLRHLPKVNPGIRWVERVRVDNGNGSEVVLHGVEEDNEREKFLFNSLTQKWRYASEDEKCAIEDFIAGPVE